MDGLNVFDIAARENWAGREWLVVGKGPSFAVLEHQAGRVGCHWLASASSNNRPTSVAGDARDQLAASVEQVGNGDDKLDPMSFEGGRFDTQSKKHWQASGTLPAPVMTLNHAIAALPEVAGESPRIVAHAVDLEVLDECGEAIAARADYLLMPWMPNRDHRRGRDTLADLQHRLRIRSRKTSEARSKPGGILANPATSMSAPRHDPGIRSKSSRSTHSLLRSLAEEGRLLWYDRVGSRVRRGTHDPVPIRFFSAEGAFGVLARCGVRRIVSAGIDGGTDYAGAFGHLRPLANGRVTFDEQLPMLEAIARRWNIDWRRMPSAAGLRARHRSHGIPTSHRSARRHPE